MSTENETWRDASSSEENSGAGRDGNQFNREGSYSRPSYNRENGDRLIVRDLIVKMATVRNVRTAVTVLTVSALIRMRKMATVLSVPITTTVLTVLAIIVKVATVLNALTVTMPAVTVLTVPVITVKVATVLSVLMVTMPVVTALSVRAITRTVTVLNALMATETATVARFAVREITIPMPSTVRRNR